MLYKANMTFPDRFQKYQTEDTRETLFVFFFFLRKCQAITVILRVQRASGNRTSADLTAVELHVELKIVCCPDCCFFFLFLFCCFFKS